MPINKETFDKIAELLSNSGFTFAEIADCCSVSAWTVSKIAIGKHTLQAEGTAPLRKWNDAAKHTPTPEEIAEACECIQEGNKRRREDDQEGWQPPVYSVSDLLTT